MIANAAAQSVCWAVRGRTRRTSPRCRHTLELCKQPRMCRDNICQGECSPDPSASRSPQVAITSNDRFGLDIGKVGHLSASATRDCRVNFVGTQIRCERQPSAGWRCGRCSAAKARWSIRRSPRTQAAPPCPTATCSPAPASSRPAARASSPIRGWRSRSPGGGLLPVVGLLPSPSLKVALVTAGGAIGGTIYVVIPMIVSELTSQSNV